MDETSYRARLNEQDWGDVHARLLDFATSRLGSKKHEAQAKDLAQEAIARVYAHDSKWDPDREPDLVRYLMGVVNSLLWNERTRFGTQKRASMEHEATRLAAERVVDPRAPSEATMADDDLLTRRLALLRERMVDDANALALLDALERGLSSPAEIRAATGWSASTLLAVRRRMLRAAAIVARDLGGASDEDERDGIRSLDEDEEAGEEVV